MLSFIANSTMSRDVGTFGLAIELLHCAFSTGKFKTITLHLLSTIALCCATLAGKYYSQKPASLMAAIATLGAAYSPLDMAQFETEMFQVVGGNLLLPTAYRMLIELVGCPTGQSLPIHKSIFSWSIIIMYTIEVTRTVFIGNPSDIAQLAVEIAIHYHRLTDLAVLPGCIRDYRMQIKALKEGAAIVYEELATFDKYTRAQMIDSLTIIQTGMLSKAPPLVFETLHSIFTGKIHLGELLIQEDSEERTEEMATAVKRQLSGTTTIVSSVMKKPAPLLSPDVSF
jgi:hypothetical protein